jgi:hypothetical protein
MSGTIIEAARARAAARAMAQAITRDGVELRAAAP